MATVNFYVDNTHSVNGNGHTSAEAAAPGDDGAWNSLANIRWNQVSNSVKVGPHDNDGIDAGNSVQINLQRGNVYSGTDYLSVGYGGSSASVRVIITAYGTGDAPQIKPTTVTTTWALTAGQSYVYEKVVGSPLFTTTGNFGVWEDDAPMTLGAGATDATLSPGQFYFAAGTLYIRTYESDDPAGHTIERSTSGGYVCLDINDKDYLTISHLRLRRSNVAGVYILGTPADIILNYSVITENDVGIQMGSAATLTTNNLTVWGNPYAAVWMQNAAGGTLNATNCIFGGVLSTYVINAQATNTANLTNCIEAGTPRGKYWLNQTGADGPGGTFNRTAPIYKNPRFVNGGSNGLSFVTFSLDDYPGDSGTATYSDSVTGVLGDDWTWHITTKAYLNNQWAKVLSAYTAGVDISVHTRNHLVLATDANGSDLTNAITINYAGVCDTATAAYNNATHLLTTTINGGAGLSIDVTDTDLDGYNVTYLGNATTGLIGYINAQANYTAAYSTPALHVDSSGTAKYASSTVIANQTGVNIKAVNGDLALDQDRLINTEVFDTDRAGGWMTEVNDQVSPGTVNPVSFSTPFYYWSANEISRLYDRGIRFVGTGSYNDSVANAVRGLMSQWYMAQVIGFPTSSAEKMDLQTAADGTNEGENIAAFLSAYPAVWNLLNDAADDANNGISITALTAFKNVYDITIKSQKDAATALAAAGTWDTTRFYVIRKIVPTFDFRLESSSPAINAGTNVSLTTDYVGNHVPKGSSPDIGAYEYQGGGAPGFHLKRHPMQ